MNSPENIPIQGNSIVIPTNTDYVKSIPIATKYSQDHPELYVLIVDCFGLFLTAIKRLSIDSPGGCPWYVNSDEYGYFKRGKFHKFTEKQRIAYENFGLGCE